MTIDGINGVNTQIGQMGINQAADSYTRNIQNQIANAQKQLQELSSNENLTLEEKKKKKQEIQKQISDLNMQLRQHQIEQRREKQQAKGSSMDDMLGGSTEDRKTGSKGQGFSQASMTALISADNSMKQARVHDSVASRFEGRAGVLEIEIKLDESRAVNGLVANTESKKAELAEAEQKAMDAATSQMETLREVNKSLEEANKADERSDKADKKSEQSQAKDEGNVSGADDQEKAVSFGEKENEQSDEMPRQPAAYSPIDVRL